MKPMLARETDKAFDHDDWIFEIKWDGYRAIAAVEKERVSLYSRNGISFNDSYPAVCESLSLMKIRAVLDGEIVVVEDSGRSDFQKLQHYDPSGDALLQYFVFDILEMNGKDLTGLSLLERKAILKKLLKNDPVIRYSDHVEASGISFFKAAGKSGLEGIMAKKSESLYYPGVRTTEWLKIKHHQTMEAVIGGFTAPTGSRKHIGALVLGTWENGKLRYIGHTGSGFSEKTLNETYAILQPLVRGKSPFDEAVKTNTPVTWVEPKLVCEVKYAQVTSGGKLRIPIFLRLRDDKTSKEITMESAKKIKPAAKDKLSQKPKKDNRAKSPTVPTRLAKKTDEEGMVKVGKVKVKTTNREKIYFPEDRVTKGDVIDYYQSVADVILPYLKNRPQSLKRNPGGIHEQGFYHKDAGEEAPAWVKSIPIHSESSDKEIDYILCNDAATLMYLNNLGCIEINPWHSTVKALDKPDYLIIDIDPSDKNTFDQVIETAQMVKSVLDKAGAESFCKTSGSTGLHIYVPTAKKYTYDQLKDFAQLICILTHEQLPGFTSMERNLKKRGNKHIYLDHLQNRRGQTIASAYSLRPKEGATISTPLEWKEVKKGLLPLDFTIHNIHARLKKKGDLFKGVLGKGIDLKKCLANLEKAG